ncbi:MAG: C1 family peptidase [Alistipes communis]
MSRYKPSDYETRTPLFGFRRIADRLRPLPVTSLRRNRYGRPLPDHRRRIGPATPVRNQAKSGTCWAFGGVSLIESEAIRTRRCTPDLSEMWVVRHAYFEKAVKYVRTRGRVAFDQGGEIQDVLWLVDRYGIVPQSLYEGGAADGTYDHASLAKAIRRLAKRIVDKNCMKRSIGSG